MSYLFLFLRLFALFITFLSYTRRSHSESHIYYLLLKSTIFHTRYLSDRYTQIIIKTILFMAVFVEFISWEFLKSLIFFLKISFDFPKNHQSSIERSFSRFADFNEISSLLSSSQCSPILSSVLQSRPRVLRQFISRAADRATRPTDD
jgi:hypothetical protein